MRKHRQNIGQMDELRNMHTRWLVLEYPVVHSVWAHLAYELGSNLKFLSSGSLEFYEKT